MSEEKNLPEEKSENKNTNTENVNPHFPEDSHAPKQQAIGNEQTLLIKTSADKQETKDMEVHHHSHAAHGKKNWKAYFWEFLMLFLVVFCGFLAEYQLEHQIEKERGKEYIRSFYDDLNKNLVTCSRIIDINKGKIDALNNMEACYDSLSTNWKTSSCLTGLIRNSSFYWSVEFSDGTIDQLKNAGGFGRLFNKVYAKRCRPRFAAYSDDSTCSHDIYSQCRRHQSFTQRIFNSNGYGQWCQCIITNYFEIG